MKIFNKIIIFVLLIFALLIFVESDYKSIPSKVLSYIEQGLHGTDKIYQEDNIIENNISNTADGSNDNSSIKKVATPGVLNKVSSDYLASDVKSTNLTIAGVLKVTNEYRKANGDLSELKENSKLDFSAEKKLQDMFVKGYFEHESPSGLGVGDLADQVSYEYIIIGENLALGNFKDDRALVDAWMASPGHRANILNKRYQEIGIAVGHGIYKGKDVWMAVQHFALPRSSCPSVDDVLKGYITIEQEKIKSMEADLSKRRSYIESGAIMDGMTTNDQIEEYNSIVNDYNKLIVEIKKKVETYNEQVREFNNCIAES